MFPALLENVTKENPICRPSLGPEQGRLSKFDLRNEIENSIIYISRSQSRCREKKGTEMKTNEDASSKKEKKTDSSNHNQVKYFLNAISFLL